MTPGLTVRLLTPAFIVSLMMVVAVDREGPREAATVADDTVGDTSSPRETASLSGDSSPRGTVTLAFAGDIHFEGQLTDLPSRPGDPIGPITRTLRRADITMVNLESAITTRGSPESKELEVPSQRFHFRTSPAALDLLADAGVDVVTMGNNHGADFGRLGLQDTLRAIDRSPVPVVGIGANRQEAFAPYEVRIKQTDFAFFGADAAVREGASSVWSAGPANAGVAAAREPRPQVLLEAVRTASERVDVVVVYLHWGAEQRSCPTRKQLVTATALADAGADVIVGSHTHIPVGSEWLGDTYVNYGLGNFLWYHNNQRDSGVLQVEIRDGDVVGDTWFPAQIGPGGRPLPLASKARRAAIDRWMGLRDCVEAGRQRLEQTMSTSDTARDLPPYSSSSSAITAGLRDRMRYSHRPGCPLPLTELRYLRMRYVGFDGRSHMGEMVVHQDHEAAVRRAFGRLYQARWPIYEMTLVDTYQGDDDRSMSANNTSGYNCRNVAGTDRWSEHSYGAAIDINPIQNPYVTSTSIAPPEGVGFSEIARGAGAVVPQGVIKNDDPVVRAFAEAGWEWGGTWQTSKDYQHFSASGR